MHDKEINFILIPKNLEQPIYVSFVAWKLTGKIYMLNVEW